MACRKAHGAQPCTARLNVATRTVYNFFYATKLTLPPRVKEGARRCIWRRRTVLLSMRHVRLFSCATVAIRLSPTSAGRLLWSSLVPLRIGRVSSSSCRSLQRATDEDHKGIRCAGQGIVQGEG